MMTPNFDDIVFGLIFIGFMIGVIIFGGWWTIDWLFIDDAIRTTTPILPDLEINVVNGVPDTVYVYRF